MAYSRSPSTLRKIEDALASIALGMPTYWLRPGGDAAQWAYKIREGLYIARLHPLRFPNLAFNGYRFAIEVVSTIKVQARLKSGTSEQGALVEPVVTQGFDNATPDHASHTVVQAHTAREIIQHWLSIQTTQPSNDTFHYPDARLSEQELRVLANWAALRTPPWAVIQVPGTNAVSLSPASKGTKLPVGVVVSRGVALSNPS